MRGGQRSSRCTRLDLRRSPRRATRRAQVERDGHRGQLAEVVDRERADAVRERGHRVERHQRAGARSARRACDSADGIALVLAARARGSPSTGWSACRSSRPGASRRRCRARSRSARAVTPSAEALSRSISTVTCGLRDLQVARHVVQAGQRRAASARSARRPLVELARCRRSCSVYWYRLLVSWPPMRIGGRFCRKTRDAGDARRASAAAPAMTSSAGWRSVARLERA